jgi:cytochrome c553
MRDRRVLAVALTAGIATLGAAALADDATRRQGYGRHLAQECTACHRLDGVDNGIPAIVGWDAHLFARTLEFYRTGERTNPVMVSVVKSLDADQIRALADYYAGLPKAAPQPGR